MAEAQTQTTEHYLDIKFAQFITLELTQLPPSQLLIISLLMW